MKRVSDDTARMIRYLLGDITEQEQTEIEEQFFADEDSYQQLEALEDELRYDYAQGNLTPQQRKLFEARFLTAPVEQQKVDLARAVLAKAREAVREGAETKVVRSWRQILVDFMTMRPVSFASAAMAATAAICAVAFFSQTLDLRRELNQLRTSGSAAQVALNQEKSRDQALSQQLQQERSRREQLEQQAQAQKTVTPPLILAFTLGPGLLRDTDGAKRLRVDPAAEAVRLQLQLKPADRSADLRAALLNLDGAELWSQDVQASGLNVVLTVPARLLTAGDYVVEIKSRAADAARGGEYYFTVVR